MLSVTENAFVLFTKYMRKDCHWNEWFAGLYKCRNKDIHPDKWIKADVKIANCLKEAASDRSHNINFHVELLKSEILYLFPKNYGREYICMKN